MSPFERFKKTNTEGNLWIYILSLGKEGEVIDEELGKIIFEKFGFLPDGILLSTVLYRLRRQGFIRTEKLKGKKAYSTTEAGKKELEKMMEFSADILQKI